MSTQTKCLLVTAHYLPLVGGAQTVYDALASAAPERFTVLTSSRDYAKDREAEGWQAFEDAARYEIRRIPEMRPPLLGEKPGPAARLSSHFRAARIRRRVLKAVLQEYARGDYGVICIGALDALGWLVPLLREKTTAAVVLYTHGEEISQRPYAAKVDVQRGSVLRTADGVVAVSSFTATLIAEKYGVPEGHIEVVTNGVDLDRFVNRPKENVRPQLGLGLGPLVLAVGRLVQRKGFDKLLEAWPRIRAAVPTAELAIAGTGPLGDELQRMAHQPDMQDSVHMLGHVPGELLPSLYASADLFVMPNRTMPDGDTEGFGLVFLEAAAAGTPGIGGRAGGAVDAIIDGKTGLQVDGEDVSAIAFAVSNLLTDEVQRTTMADTARAYALTQGWPAKAEQLLAFFDRIAAGKSTDG